MGHLNLPSSKQRNNARQWRLLDLVTAILFGAVFIFFVLVFTPLGDSLAASGRQTLLRSSMGAADPLQRARLVALVESTGNPVIDSCPAEMVDHMPCEDPRINSQLSREMNFYRERHCPAPEQTPLCLIPPPQGNRVWVQWPESLRKVLMIKLPYMGLCHFLLNLYILFKFLLQDWILKFFWFVRGV